MKSSAVIVYIVASNNVVAECLAINISQNSDQKSIGSSRNSDQKRIFYAEIAHLLTPTSLSARSVLPR